MQTAWPENTMTDMSQDPAKKKRFQFRYWHLLCFVVSASGLAWLAHRHFFPRPVPPWEAKIRQNLERQITVDFKDISLPDALEELGYSNDEFILIVDAQVRKKHGKLKISIPVSKTSFEDALERILDGSRVSYAIIDHVVFVAEQRRLDEARRFSNARFRSTATQSATQLRIRKELARQGSFCWIETPLKDALYFLGGYGHVKIVLDDSVEKFRDAPLYGNYEQGLPLEAALAWTVRSVGLEYEVRGDHVFVSTPDRLKK